MGLEFLLGRKSSISLTISHVCVSLQRPQQWQRTTSAYGKFVVSPLCASAEQEETTYKNGRYWNILSIYALGYHGGWIL